VTGTVTLYRAATIAYFCRRVLAVLRYLGD